ncbi:Beta-lactamase domain-containing protein 2 [Hondaea fermentalgiana]|uniref:Beta-lactamase domain-containing protein 2 n=1 Tax=Hondaea fermentalgiana TaxID=2315210 RepID=A0A2R5GZS6_9STRA|nr:Beta-lactamase domain-containing protein 2 [Hondaea fermentalgiana]|eukprot:GBG33554.1 Beta-lactamase domain-containing protein 2 [Hondaea fermentalgiana]
MNWMYDAMAFRHGRDAGGGGGRYAHAELVSGGPEDNHCPWHRQPWRPTLIVAHDLVMFAETAFTQGGVGLFSTGAGRPLHPATEGRIGWGGFGGNHHAVYRKPQKMGVSASTLRTGVRLLIAREALVPGPDGVSAGRIAALTAVLVTLAAGAGGIRHPLWARVLGIGSWVKRGEVHGTVAPGFEGVRKAFKRNVDAGMERGAQLVIYHKGEKVVDLYGGTLGSAYDGESIQVIYSCSKNLGVLLIARAVEDGRLKYDTRVAEVWPEFAQAGKERITIADVLRHEAGLAYFKDGAQVAYELAGRKRLDELADFIAKQPPAWAYEKDLKPGARIYHAFSRGFLLEEIVRRVDARTRSLGEQVREDIAEPLGVTVVLGEPNEEEKKRISPLKFVSTAYYILRYYVKRMLFQAYPDDIPRFNAFADPTSRLVRSFTPIDMSRLDTPAEYYNDPKFLDIECASVTAISNARSLGKIADLIARREYLKPETLEKMEANPIVKFDHSILLETAYTQGGINVFGGGSKPWHPATEGHIGWGGFGGNMWTWMPDEEVGFAYLQNGNMLGSLFGFRDQRCLRISKALRVCLDKKAAAENKAK